MHSSMPWKTDDLLIYGLLRISVTHVIILLTDPQNWLAVQVMQWLNWAICEFSLEGINMGNFNMLGKDLIQLGREAFLSRAPPFMGDILWEHLEILQKGDAWEWGGCHADVFGRCKMGMLSGITFVLIVVMKYVSLLFL